MFLDVHNPSCKKAPAILSFKLDGGVQDGFCNAHKRCITVKKLLTLFESFPGLTSFILVIVHYLFTQRGHLIVFLRFVRLSTRGSYSSVFC